MHSILGKHYIYYKNAQNNPENFVEDTLYLIIGRESCHEKKLKFTINKKCHKQLNKKSAKSSEKRPIF